MKLRHVDREESMGSFTEVVMSFEFREDTPEEVLAAFSALERPLQGEPWYGPAPSLPDPVVEPSEFWEPDWRESGAPDEFETEPWRHDWAAWVSSAMDVSTVPSGHLVWMPMKRWNLSVRCSFKSWPEAIIEFLEWLGPFIENYGNDDRRQFIGYLHDEGSERPHLLWAHNGALEIEDLK